MWINLNNWFQNNTFHNGCSPDLGSAHGKLGATAHKEIKKNQTSTHLLFKTRELDQLQQQKSEKSEIPRWQTSVPLLSASIFFFFFARGISISV
jgi:hypothetical protein